MIVVCLRPPRELLQGLIFFQVSQSQAPQILHRVSVDKELPSTSFDGTPDALQGGLDLSAAVRWAKRSTATPARCTHLLTVSLLHEFDDGAHLCTTSTILTRPCGRYTAVRLIAHTLVEGSLVRSCLGGFYHMVQSVSLGPLGLELLRLVSSICRSSHRTHTRRDL